MDVCESILACFGSATSAHKTDANMQSNIALFASDKPLCLKASVTGATSVSETHVWHIDTGLEKTS